jgi:DNA-binding LacI/PurR family transcriptional regulator
MAKRRSSSTAKAPRMIDIARRAGVSRMAVSAVLMGTGQGRIAVSPETAERIRDIARELDYRPNRAAQMLASRRSNVIALVANDFKNHLTQGALAWLHEVAEEHGYRVLTATSSGDDVNSLQHLLRDVRSGWVGGLVYLAYQNEPQWPAIAEILSETPNTVVALSDIGASGVPSVVADVAAGAAESVRHLAARGKRRLLLATEEDETPAIRARIDAYEATARACGVRFKRSEMIVDTKGWIIGDPRYLPRFIELAERIRGRKVDAVVCDNDFMAATLVRAFRRIGVSTPEEIAVVGWGDLPFAKATDPMLTTVSYRLSEVLGRAMDRLEERMEGKRPAEAGVEFVPPQLVVRESA